MMVETQALETFLDKMPSAPLKLAPETIFCIDRPLTVEDFYELVDEDTNVELIEGVITTKSPVSYQHETLFSFLHTILTQYVEERNLGQVLGSRTVVRITNYTAREPDLLFVSKDRLSIIHKNDLVEAPDLVIEIVSPYDRRQEIITKQVQYEQIGVREFWLIDQPKQQIIIYDLDTGGRFVRRPLQGNIIHSTTVDGFQIQIEWLWSEPGRFPSTLSIVNSLLNTGRVESEHKGL
ncbi:MAG: Uma2 family endonuclease [bacterium]